MNRKERRAQKKRVKKLMGMANAGLDKIYSSSEYIAKEWGVRFISLGMLKEIVDKSKLKVETDNVELIAWVNQYNKTLDIMYLNFEDRANEMESKNVSLKFIKNNVDHVKENMK